MRPTTKKNDTIPVSNKKDVTIKKKAPVESSSKKVEEKKEESMPSMIEAQKQLFLSFTLAALNVPLRELVQSEGGDVNVLDLKEIQDSLISGPVVVTTDVKEYKEKGKMTLKDRIENAKRGIGCKYIPIGNGRNAENKDDACGAKVAATFVGTYSGDKSKILFCSKCRNLSGFVKNKGVIDAIEKSGYSWAEATGGKIMKNPYGNVDDEDDDDSDDE